MPKRLVVLAGPDEGRTFVLGADPLLLGRSRATESKLIDPHVSRVHCQVHLEGEHYVVSDFDSAAGTFVNGKRITKHQLQAGDLVRIGNTRMQFFEELEVKKIPSDLDVKIPLNPDHSILVDPLVKRPPHIPTEENKRLEPWVGELPGQKIGNYKVGSLLARGKSGYVFHARDTRKNSDVILKVLDPRFGADEKIVMRFVEAMKTVLPLRHPNLVKVLGAGKAGPNCWMAMEYVSGESLAAFIGRIETSGHIDWRNVLRMIAFLAQALHYAHGKNIIHQNVTPPNILLGKSIPNTKLADLMLAIAIERDPAQPINAAGEPSDDLPYMSPERTDGPGKPVDARTDIYSLGATAYALLAGHPPFQANTTQDLIGKIRLQAPPPLKLLHPELPDTFESILQRMLAKRPEDRFQSTRDLYKELEKLAQNEQLGS